MSHSMRYSAYLALSRHSIYYFRWPVPKKLHPQGKSGYIKVSLSTRNPKEALRLSTFLEYGAQRLIHTKDFSSMNYGEITEIIRSYFVNLLDKRKEAIYQNGPLNGDATQGLLSTIGNVDECLKHKSSTDIFFSMIDKDLEPIIEGYAIDLSTNPDLRATFQQRYLEGLREYCTQLIEYNQAQQRFDFTSSPKEKANNLAAVVIKPENQLANVIDNFVEEQSRADKWGVRALEERLACFELLKEILGTDFNIMNMNVPTARQVKDILQKIPCNRNKMASTKGLSLMEAIEVPNVKRLSVESINKYLTIYNSFFDWATTNGYIEKNPFYKMRMPISKKKKDKRRNFSKSETDTMIAELSKRNEGLANKDFKYWGVLIALYTGARLNEVASLHLTDIKQNGDIWYFDINDTEETKRLKTQAATRLVPIHPDLIAYGFIDFVEKRKASGQKMLLPDLSYSAKQGYGRNLGDWFNNVFLVKLNIKSTETVFHSMRHTVISKLRQSGVDQYIVRNLVGHEANSVTEDYTHGYSLKQLMASIMKIDYS